MPERLDGWTAARLNRSKTPVAARSAALLAVETIGVPEVEQDADGGSVPHQ